MLGFHLYMKVIIISNNINLLKNYIFRPNVLYRVPKTSHKEVDDTKAVTSNLLALYQYF